MDLFGGWNMIANPVDRVPGGDSLRLLYPTTTSPNAFGFNPASGYVPTAVLDNGAGYWAKFAGDHSAILTGSPYLSSAVSVETGWNMIAGLSQPVSTASITSVPAGIVVSDWFGYSSGYDPVTVIEPGRGYWVKISTPGHILFSATHPAPPSAGTTQSAAQAFHAPERTNPIDLGKGKGRWGK